MVVIFIVGKDQGHVVWCRAVPLRPIVMMSASMLHMVSVDVVTSICRSHVHHLFIILARNIFLFVNKENRALKPLVMNCQVWLWNVGHSYRSLTVVL